MDNTYEFCRKWIFVHEQVRRLLHSQLLETSRNRQHPSKTTEGDYNDDETTGDDHPYASFLQPLLDEEYLKLEFLTDLFEIIDPSYVDYLCAVDGLRKDPREGEKRTFHWYFYLDNLKRPIYPLIDPNDPLESSLAAHSNAVRRMYAFLRTSEEVNETLLNVYGGPQPALPPCEERDRTAGTKALRKYMFCMRYDQAKEVASALDLDIVGYCSRRSECSACVGWKRWPEKGDEKKKKEEDEGDDCCCRDEKNVPWTTVRVHESVRRYLFHKRLWRDESPARVVETEVVPREYLVDSLEYLAHRGRWHPSKECGRIRVEYTCAVDGLRGGGGSYDWKLYLDNLQYPMLCPWEEFSVVGRRVSVEEAHVHAVRRLYFLSRFRPEKVHSVLRRVYRSETAPHHLDRPCQLRERTCVKTALRTYLCIMEGLDRVREFAAGRGLEVGKFEDLKLAVGHIGSCGLPKSCTACSDEPPPEKSLSSAATVVYEPLKSLYHEIINPMTVV